MEKYGSITINKDADEYWRFAITMTDKNKDKTYTEYMYSAKPGDWGQFPEADVKLFAEFENKLTNWLITEDDLIGEKSEFFIYVLENFDSISNNINQLWNFKKAMSNYLDSFWITIDGDPRLKANTISIGFEIDGSKTSHTETTKEFMVSPWGTIIANHYVYGLNSIVTPWDHPDKSQFDWRLQRINTDKIFSEKEEFEKLVWNYRLLNNLNGSQYQDGLELKKHYNEALISKAKESDPSLNNAVSLFIESSSLTNFGNHQCFWIIDDKGSDRGFLTFMDNGFKYLSVGRDLEKWEDGRYKMRQE